MATPSEIVASKEMFLLSDRTVRVRVDGRSMPTGKGELVVHTLAEDLLFLLPRLRLDLAATLGITSDDYLLHGEDLVEELCDDLERLLRYQLLSSVTLLLCDPEPDPAAATVVRYLCDYTPVPALPGGQDSIAEGLRSLPALDHIERDTLRLVLVVQWEAAADRQTRAQLRRPRYHFEWSSPLDADQRATVVRFRQAVEPPPFA